MALLRRSTTVGTPTDDVDPQEELDRRITAGKGRPTPKRQSSRQNRRQSIPKDRKEAEKLRRQRTKELRRTQRTALMTGDEKNLPARDSGPARRLARDIVDERFTIGQFSIAMVLVLFILSSTSDAALGLIVRLALVVLVIAILAQSYLIAKAAKRAVEDKHGFDEAQGISMYVFMRAVSARRMRRPPPQVKRTRFF